MKTKRGMTGKRKKPSEPLTLQGSVWLAVGRDNLAGKDRIGLLRAIAEQGSITQAAKAVGMSYKAAWDAVETMSNLAGEPLVERTTGGRGGGSTLLTTRGTRLVERFAHLDEAHQRFVKLLSEESTDLQTDFAVLRTLNMKTSARNQFSGTVTAVRSGAVNDEVELTLPGGTRIVAVVTRESTESLGLRTNISAFALIKASSVIVATELHKVKLSARNQLPGKVSALTPGAVNTEVVIAMDGGGSIAAIVTQASAKDLRLAVGMQATALFKASSVILGVMA